MVRLATTIIDAVRREGAEFLSAYPTTPLIDTAARQNFRPVLCRQERTGVHIADGFSRVRNGRQPGVFAMQWGPGVENAYAGVATAFADSVPMLVLPLGYPADLADMPRFTTADHLAPIAKSVERLRSPAELEPVLRRTMHRLRHGRPGPVVLEVPTDVALAPIDEPLSLPEPVTPARSAGDPAAIEDAARLLAQAERPFILAGQGVLYAEAGDELLTLAEFLDAPVATTLEGKSAFPETHPLSVGTGSVVMPLPLLERLATADVILAVGASLTKHPMALDLPTGTPLIHITADPDDVGKDTDPTCAVVGDAELVLADLTSVLAGRLGGGGVERGTAAALAGERADWLRQWQPLLDSDETPINPYRVVADLGRVLDPDTTILTHDSGSPRDQLTPFYRATVPRSYLGWGKSHALGTGLGLIIGAKLAAPEKTCVHVMGDAAFGMVGLDFETAVRNRIPIIAVVLNNSTMAIETRALPVAHQRYQARDIGGDYAELGRAMGGWSIRVDRPGDLAPALGKAVDITRDGTPALVEVITSPEETPFSCRGGARTSAEATEPTEPRH